MKKAHWITICIGALLVTGLYFFGKKTAQKKAQPIVSQQDTNQQPTIIPSDSILFHVKKELNQQQLAQVETFEKSLTSANEPISKRKALLQLAHYWGDSLHFFAPYALYEAEAARLENSEKSLTFAAHMFLDELQVEQSPQLKAWEAQQAKDLFEKSLQINPNNDSSKIGLGATYLLGGISASPMEGLSKIREVLNKDSTNIFGQMIMAKGAMMSGQTAKAVTRLQTVVKLQPNNIEAILMLADIEEQAGNNKEAISWYKKSLTMIKRPDIKAEVEKRIKQLSEK